MQVYHHNPTTASIHCAESTQQQVVRLLLIFVAYCLDALGQQPPTIPKILSGLRHCFRARIINDSAFDDTLLTSMKAGVSRLPYTPRTRLPCTFDMVQHIVYKNTRAGLSKQHFVKAVAVSMAYYLCLRSSEYASRTSTPRPEAHQFDSQSSHAPISLEPNRVGQVHVATCQEYQRRIWYPNLVRCEWLGARRINVSTARVSLGSNESTKPGRPFPFTSNCRRSFGLLDI